MLARASARVHELEAELTRARAQRVAPPTAPPPTETAAKLAEANARIVELEREVAQLLARLRAGNARPHPGLRDGPLNPEEWEAARRAGAEAIAARRAAAKAAAAAQEETFETVVAERDQLRTTLKGAYIRIANLKKSKAKSIIMSQALYRQIQKTLHPDLHDGETTAVAQEFNAFLVWDKNGRPLSSAAREVYSHRP
jgi:hypothetical protein